jgi:uncharacterized protein
VRVDGALRALLTALAFAGCTGGSSVPGGGFVVDEASLVAPDSHARMDAILGAVLRDLDIEVVAASLPDLGDRPIEQVAGERFESWRIGARTRANRGVLLLVAAEQERVRVAVSYDLEPIFTDAFVAYVEREQLVPYFDGERIGEGIEATVELLARRAYEGARGAAYDPARPAADTVSGFRSGGAGAATDVRLRGARPKAAAAPLDPEQREHFGAQPTPALAWERFLELNRRRVKDAEIGLYDERARRLLGGVHANAGQDHIAKLYAGKRYDVRTQGDLAAIVFPEDPDHLLAPWFFRRSDSGWQLDGSMYPDVIGYNHLNQWRFKRRDHPYEYAFGDFRFDAHGFGFPRTAAR